MKKYILSAIVAMFLTGCASFTPSKFDPVMYSHFVELSVETSRAQAFCGDRQILGFVGHLGYRSQVVAKYAQFHPNDVREAAEAVHKVFAEMDKAYIGVAQQPSSSYCTIKLGIALNELDLILNALGRKNQ